jgi:hypothetical protein
LPYGYSDQFWFFTIVDELCDILTNCISFIRTVQTGPKTGIDHQMVCIFPCLKMLWIFTREYTQCTAGYTFCFIVVGAGATFNQTWQFQLTVDET